MTKILARILILLGGMYATGLALWHLALTAIFVHEAVYIPARVVDSTNRPFEGLVEQLRHGNLPWDGDTAYHPHVSYILFGNTITDKELPDLDNREYPDGEAVEIILHPQETHRRHISKFKFLWGGDLLLLALGGGLLGVFRLTRRRKPRHARPTAAHKPEPRRAAAPPPAPAEAQPERTPEEPPPAAPRKRRRKSTGNSSSSTPRKKKAQDTADKPKKTTRRRKKAADTPAE